jgi:hypothetical protein
MRSLAIGIDLSLAGLARRPAGGGGVPNAFTPAALFAGGSKGIWYDPSDRSSMFQDSSGTVPAAAGAPVALLRDKSGNVYDAVQPDPALRPMLVADEAGRLCLEGNGIGRWIAASFPLAQPWMRISAIRQNAWTDTRRIFSSPGSTSGLLYQRGAAPNLALHFGSSPAASTQLAVGTIGVVTERHSGSSSRIAIGNGAFASGNATSAVATGVMLFAGSGGAMPANARCYGLVVIDRDLSDDELISVRGFLAAKAGIAL